MPNSFTILHPPEVYKHKFPEEFCDVFAKFTTSKYDTRTSLGKCLRNKTKATVSANIKEKRKIQAYK